MFVAGCEATTGGAGYEVAIYGAWPGFVDGCDVGSAVGVVKAVADGAD